jgi:hypothetical protein
MDLSVYFPSLITSETTDGFNNTLYAHAAIRDHLTFQLKSPFIDNRK